MRHVPSHVFPWPSSLFHGHGHPRVPRPCREVLGHRPDRRLSCSTGGVGVRGVVGAWPIRSPCLVLAVETPQQNNTLCFPSSFHLRISKHFADIKRTLPARSAAGERGCSRGESQLSRSFCFLPWRGNGLTCTTSHGILSSAGLSGALSFLSCISETETGSCPCFLTISNKLSPL